MDHQRAAVAVLDTAVDHQVAVVIDVTDATGHHGHATTDLTASPGNRATCSTTLGANDTSPHHRLLLTAGSGADAGGGPRVPAHAPGGAARGPHLATAAAISDSAAVTTDAAAAADAAGSAGQTLEPPDQLRAVHALPIPHLAASATRARRGATIAVTDVPGHHTTNGVSDAAFNYAVGGSVCTALGFARDSYRTGAVHHIAGPYFGMPPRPWPAPPYLACARAYTGMPLRPALTSPACARTPWTLCTR